MSDDVPTLYAWAGGADALVALFTRFYELVPEDPLVGPLFAGMDARHAQHVAAWVGEVFGGPADYTASRGGYRTMLEHHLGKDLTEAQRRRWVSLLQDAAEQVGLPDDPEFRSAFLAYVEWGSRLAVQNSATGAAVVEEAPVPRWGWGESPPYTPG